MRCSAWVVLPQLRRPPTHRCETCTLQRLVEATRSLKIGPAEDPGNRLGAVIDQAAYDRIRNYIEIGRRDAGAKQPTRLRRRTGNDLYRPSAPPIEDGDGASLEEPIHILPRRADRHVRATITGEIVGETKGRAKFCKGLARLGEQGALETAIAPIENVGGPTQSFQVR